MIKNHLIKGKVLYIWQIAALSNKALYNIRGIGKVSIREIRANINMAGFRETILKKIFGFETYDLKPHQELDLITKTKRIDEIRDFLISKYSW